MSVAVGHDVPVSIETIPIPSAAGEVIDCHGGLRDLEAGVLRHTSERFAEDPLRVLRGGSFASKANAVRSASRFRYDHDVRYYANGFRVARDAR